MHTLQTDNANIILWRLYPSLPNVQTRHIQKTMNSKTCVKRPLSKRTKIGIQYSLSLNAGQKYCRTFIKLPFVIKIFVLSILSVRFTQVLLYTHMRWQHISPRFAMAKHVKKFNLVPSEATYSFSLYSTPPPPHPTSTPFL